MKLARFVRISLGWLGVLIAIMAASANAATKTPNIVIILADDLGYGDLANFGHPTIRTPSLDRMAAEGTRFTDFYVAACVCTPSRAALLTGRLPIRNGMAGSQQRRVIYPQDTGGLPPGEVTIATALKSKGYATACIGKWHLGHQPSSQPSSHGFDLFFGLPYSNDMDRTPGGRRADTASLDPAYEDFNVPLIQNGEVVERPAVQTTLTKRYTEKALEFIRANRKKPFFLYFPHTFPHVPLFASEQFKGKSPRGLYGDAVEELDWSVGEILDALRKEKLARNTFVFFTSDNGPWLVKNLAGGSAGLLREGKGSTWEGGMRVPGIAWWPGKIKPGTVTRELACSMDLFNTSLTLAGVPIPTDRSMDGVDMAPILFEGGRSLRETILYYRGNELFAVRKGAFKAHFQTSPGYASPGNPLKFEKHEPPLLFNVAKDPSERFDVAQAHPDVVTDIQRIVEAHQAGLVPAAPRY